MEVATRTHGGQGIHSERIQPSQGDGGPCLQWAELSSGDAVPPVAVVGSETYVYFEFRNTTNANVDNLAITVICPQASEYEVCRCSDNFYVERHMESHYGHVFSRRKPGRRIVYRGNVEEGKLISFSA